MLDVLETAEAVSVPVVALGELRAGFRAGRRAVDNEKRLAWFLSQGGITTLAVEHGLVLYTRDAHFQEMPGLAIL